MSLDKYLSEKNGIFQNTTQLQDSSPTLGNVVAVNESGAITFYSVDSSDGGLGLNFNNGLFANKITDPTLTDLSKVIPQTVSGTLTTGGRINQIRDSGAFTLPLANSVDADTILVVELPDTYKAQVPTITASGTDNIQDGDGTDTSITFTGAAKLTLTSNGVDTWSL